MRQSLRIAFLMIIGLAIGTVYRPAMASAQELPSCPTPTTYTVRPGDMLSLLAEQFGTDVGTLMRLNHLSDPNHIEVGQVLRLPCSTPLNFALQAAAMEGIVGGLEVPVVAPSTGWFGLWQARAGLFRQMRARHLPFRLTWRPSTLQPGDVAVVNLSPTRAVTLTAAVDLFNQWNPLVRTDIGLQGFIPLHGFTAPGLLTVTVGIRVGTQPTVTLALPLWVRKKAFDVQYIHLPPSKGSLLQPAIVRAERKRLGAIWGQVSGPPLWKGAFTWPVDIHRWPTTAPYGGRRSYNGGPVNSYHTGQDIAAPRGTPVRAPAAGVVRLAGPLQVRGNAVVIDHGSGVMSNYWHLSKINVHVGERVKRGQILGLVGTTGLSTGAHLHWEMRVYGIPVDPVPWTRTPGPANGWRLRASR